MGCSSKVETFFSKLEVNKLAEDTIICGNVLFWNSAEFLVLTAGPSCQMYSVNTGDFLKDLFRCESRIVSCHHHPEDNSLIYALSDRGELVKYNLQMETVVTRVNLMLKAFSLNKKKVPNFSVKKKFFGKDDCDKTYVWNDELLNSDKRQFHYGVPISVNSNILYWASWSLDGEHQSHVSVFTANDGIMFDKITLHKTPYKKCYKNFSLASYKKGNILFVGMGSNFVHVSQFHKGDLTIFSQRLHLLGDEVEVTSLTLNQNELSFATSDSRGVILVWHNILDKHPLKCVCHWHTVQIRDMAFSSEGSHLFSGGDEHVLVKWSFLSNMRDYLPRLSSPVCFISVAQDSTLVAVSLADNEIYIIGSNFEKISVIKKASIFMPENTEKCYDILTVDPRNDHLVLNGRPGHLQFLSHKKSLRILYSLDVGKVNYMTGDKSLKNLEITHAKFSTNGSVLVTAEAKRDPLLVDYRIKFWDFNETNGCFTLNTCVELPHGENDIYGLEVGSDDLVATAGADKQFKLWGLFETTEGNIAWSVVSSGRYKSLTCGPLDFSKDTTLIAVGFGPSLTLWNTNDYTLKCSLIPPFKRDRLTFVKFGSEEFSHLIVTATDFEITTWNVITMTVVWTVDLEVSYLVSDFFNSYMCAFSKSNTLFVFSPGAISPELVMENVSDAKIVAAQAATYANETNPFCLYFYNSRRELFCLMRKDEVGEDDEVEVVGDYVTPFSAIVPQRSGGDVTKSIADYVPSKSKKTPHYVSSILDAPAHALLNPRKFCYNFLESLADKLDKPDETDGKVKKQSNEDVIEVVNGKGFSESADDVISEELLWTTVDELFK